MDEGRTGERESAVRTDVFEDRRGTNSAIAIGWYAIGENDAA